MRENGSMLRKNGVHLGRPALVLRSPSLLRYDVQFDDGEIQKNVRHTHVEPPPLPPDLLHLRRGEIQAPPLPAGPVPVEGR